MRLISQNLRTISAFTEENFVANFCKWRQL